MSLVLLPVYEFQLERLKVALEAASYTETARRALQVLEIVQAYNDRDLKIFRIANDTEIEVDPFTQLDVPPHLNIQQEFNASRSVRIALTLQDETDERLEKLMGLYGINNKSETIRMGLNVFVSLLDAAEQGQKLVLRNSAGHEIPMLSPVFTTDLARKNTPRAKKKLDLAQLDPDEYALVAA